MKAVSFVFIVFFFCNATAHENYRVGIALSNFDYEEKDALGSLLNNEYGSLSGLRFDFRKKKMSRFFLAGIDLNQNTVRYSGETNLGNWIRSETDEQIVQFSLSYGVVLGAASPLELSAGLGYRWWRRDIQSLASVLGLLETYHWPYGHVGVSKRVNIKRNLKISMGFRLKNALNPKVHVVFPDLYDPVTVEQGQTWGAETAVSMVYCVGSHQWMIAPFVDVWHSQRSRPSVLSSRGVSVGKVSEPKSNTVVSGIRMSYSFVR